MKKTLLFFALLGMIMFTSCDKKGWDKEDYDKEEWDKDDWGDKDEEGCFDLVYPVSYTMPNGSTITGNDKEALWTAIKAWYEGNDTEEKPDLQYPVNVVFEDGETMEVDDEDEMEDLKEDCKYDKEDWECFELIYPVSYTMPDGSAITGDDEETLWTAIKAWYDAHPDVEEKPALQYPVSVVFYDEETVEVANEDEMIDLKKDCEWDKEWECFELVYPVDYEMPDGSTITGADEEELWTAIKAWYDAHPDVEEKPALQYPVSVVFYDEETIEVENEDEMIDLKKDCEWGKDWECFDLVYPVAFTMEDGTTISGADEEELWTAIKAWYDAHPDVEAEPSLQYPVDIMFEDGTTQSVANEDEMETAKESCED